MTTSETESIVTEKKLVRFMHGPRQDSSAALAQNLPPWSGLDSQQFEKVADNH